MLHGKEDRVDASAMQRLIELLLAEQLARVYEMAGERLALQTGS